VETLVVAVDDAVCEAIEIIARRNGRRPDGVQLAAKRVVAQLVHDLLRPLDDGKKFGDVDGRRRGCNPVVGGRVSLGEHQTLSTALGAAIPIRVLRALAV